MDTENKQYSPEFAELISNADKFEEIMKSNCSSGTYEQWEAKRRLIADAINADGTILDIGCAGGLFLKSLQEWSLYELVPYGIDNEESYIEAAKELFLEYENHFSEWDLNDIEDLSRSGLPTTYDFVYCSVMYDPKWMDTIKEYLLPMTKKRLILGFYAPNAHAFETDGWHQERKKIADTIQSFKDAGLECSEPVFNPNKFNQAYVIIDK